MSRQWIYVTDEYAASLTENVPEGLGDNFSWMNSRLNLYILHKTIWVEDRTGEVIPINAERVIKVMDEAVDEDWCYKVVAATVKFAERECELLDGTPIAVLPENFISQLEGRNEG